MISLPELFVPKRKHFGLSIGRTSLRAVEIDSRRQIKSIAEVILPEGVYVDGVVVKKDAFINSLQQLIVKGKFTTEYVAVCFSEIHAYSREYSLPTLANTDIREALSWHVKDLFPFSESDIYFDWKLLTNNEKEQKVTVVAVQKKVLDTLVESLVQVGLKPLGFEPSAAAITKLLNLKIGQKLLVVEINRKGAYVTLVETDKTLFTTVVSFTTADTSETYLKAIVQAIKEVIIYFKSKKILTVDKVDIVLTGELATVDWAKALNSMVQLPVKTLATPVQNPAFNKAYAMALTNVAPPTDPTTINLLPISLQSHYDALRNHEYYKNTLIRCSIALGVLTSISFVVFMGVTIKRQALDARAKQLTSQSKVQTGNTQNLLQLNAQARFITQLAPLRTTPRDKLLSLQQVIPEGITIAQWEYDDAKLMYTISGVAAKREDLLLFKEKLEQTEEFAKVNLPLGSLETPANVTFNITFTIK